MLRRRIGMDAAGLNDLKDLLLFPIFLILPLGLIAFVVALVTGGPDIFLIAGWFVVGPVITCYSVTLLIGGLGLVLMVGRRPVRMIAEHRQWNHEPDPALRQRFARPREGDHGPGLALWDDWLDGP